MHNQVSLSLSVCYCWIKYIYQESGELQREREEMANYLRECLVKSSGELSGSLNNACRTASAQAPSLNGIKRERESLWQINQSRMK